MIPVRLTLRDFLSYRDPGPIDFTGFDVACLTGVNGAGKSSLLDAMTFALFGAARGCENGQNTDRLINDSADEAMVELVFEIGGETFRIVRKKSRSRSDLRFDLQSPDGWTNLAGDTVSQTQARIADTLRMDYRTFTASAFFVQGRAASFLANMRPEDRRDVFGRLLDLGVYESLADAARERARNAEARRVAHAQRASDLPGAQAELEAVKEALAECRKTREEAELRVRTAEERLTALRADLERLSQQAAKAHAERDAIAEARQRLEADAQVRSRLTAERAQLEELCARRDEAEAGRLELERLRSEETVLRGAATRYGELMQRQAAIVARLEEARSQAVRRRAEAEQRAAKAAEDLAAIETATVQRTAVEERLASLGDVDASLGEVREQRGRRREEYARLTAAIEASLSRKALAVERLDLLKRGEAECPVCGGALDEQHRKRLTRELKAEAAAVDADVASLAAQREVATKEGKRLTEEEGRLERTKAEAEKLAAQLAALDTKLERRDEVARAKAEAESLATELASDPAPDPELAGVAGMLESLAYDPDVHDSVRHRIAELEPVASLAVRIGEAQDRLVTTAEALQTLEDSLQADEEKLAQRVAEVADLESAVADLPDVRQQEEAARMEADVLRQNVVTAVQEEAKLEERCQALTTHAADLERDRDEERRAAAEHRTYTRLVTAFGRGGIPDRIIATALPQLEHEVNQALARLTNCEMSMQFRLEKQTKAGSVRETFDVVVHHDGGVRDFQMLSGGEAFRAAFALRLGLSKLLVRRAGARLETLVIDEGFGTQDPEGRERLVEAINLARAEFRKVLVITHLDDLKDFFGPQLRVHKDTRTGSRVEVLSP